MTEDMADPRNIIEKAGFRAAEAIALQSTADEIGISKSQLIRLATMKFIRERHDQKSCRQAGLLESSELVPE
jgi:hypothetical protein